MRVNLCHSLHVLNRLRMYRRGPLMVTTVRSCVMRFGEYFRVRTDPTAAAPTASCMAALVTPRTPVVTVASSSARVVMFA